MTTLQQVRGVYERVVIDAAAPVTCYVENQEIVEQSALSEYVAVRVSFGDMQEPVIGCEALELIRGVLVCEIYTRKNVGPGRGLEIAQPIIQALSALNAGHADAGAEIIARVGRISGPAQVALEDRPHHFTRLSCPIYPRVASAQP